MMNISLTKLSGPKKLALLALILGFIAVFAGDPYDNVYTKVNTKEIASASLNNSDKISPAALADWLIQQKADYRLIDLRNEDDYSKYFIPSAFNISPVQILNSGLMRNEKIVLYSDDNSLASQSWFVLKSKDYKSVYILDGGLNAWKNDILFPKLQADASSEDIEQFNKLKEVSLFFGGSPQSGTEEIVKQEMPELKAPVQTNLTTGKKKKKREGC